MYTIIPAIGSTRLLPVLYIIIDVFHNNNCMQNGSCMNPSNTETALHRNIGLVHLFICGQCLATVFLLANSH